MRTSDVNVEILKDHVKTQYGDLTGLIQIDGLINVSSLYDLCSKKGIDREKYFIVGFGVSDFTTDGIGSHGDVSCTVLLLETEKFAKSFDEIKHQLMKTPKTEVIKITFRLNYSEFGRYFKRFDCLMLTELGNYIQEMEIIDEE